MKYRACRRALVVTITLASTANATALLVDSYSRLSGVTCTIR